MLRRVLIVGLLATMVSSASGAATPAPAFTLPLLQGGTSFDSKALVGQQILVVRFQASF